MHLICLQKFCISIVFNFSWDSCNTQDKWKAKGMQNLGGGGGVGANKVHYGRCASGGYPVERYRYPNNPPPPPSSRDPLYIPILSWLRHFWSFRPRLQGSTQIFKRAKKKLAKIHLSFTRHPRRTVQGFCLRQTELQSVTEFVRFRLNRFHR